MCVCVPTISCIYLWLCWVSAAAQAFSGCDRGATLEFQDAGFPSWWILSSCPALGHAGFSRCGPRALDTGSVVVAHGLSCPVTWVFPDGDRVFCPGRQSLCHRGTREACWLVVLTSRRQGNSFPHHFSPLCRCVETAVFKFKNNTLCYIELFCISKVS